MIACFCVAANWCVADEETRDSFHRQLLPPGKMVDVGGFRLHINCQGHGEPTVVLDSGAGGFSLEWVNIQKALAPHTRVCAYDRAGYAWSDMGPLPRTSRRIVGELKTLLERGNVPGPYVLVGHSFGGYNVQYFARRYPDDVAGIVLIDSSHPQQVERLPRAVPGPSRPRPARSRTYVVSRPVLHENYPEETGPRAYHIMSTWKYRFTQQEEMLSLPNSAKEVLQQAPLPAVPMVVLTRGLRVWPQDQHGNAMEKTWMELQDELSMMVKNATHLIAERSGHSIHLDQPGLVISALRNLIDQ